MTDKVGKYCRENDLMLLDEYISAKKPLKLYCNVCTLEFFRPWDSLRKNKHKCKKSI